MCTREECYATRAVSKDFLFLKNRKEIICGSTSMVCTPFAARILGMAITSGIHFGLRWEYIAKGKDTMEVLPFLYPRQTDVEVVDISVLYDVEDHS